MVGSSEEKKELAHNDNQEVTVDDVIPVLRELIHRLEALEQELVKLKEHEHGLDGKPVVRL